ncbi:MAG: PIN/TRAM domain-containing protein [Armatimonadota bacterium]
MLTRLAGLLFSLAIGATAAFVAVQWSGLYVQEFQDTTSFKYFREIYTVLFGAVGLLIGFTIASLIYRQALDLSSGLLSDLRRVPGRDKMAVVIGIFIGLGITVLLGVLLIRIEKFGPQLVLLIGIIAIYFGVAITLSMKEELYFFFPNLARAPEASDKERSGSAIPKLLDTNVIIDGRIADIARAGFVEGSILVPDFVLEELHLIADSSDTLRRNRGRRGLDILNGMQQEADLNIRVLTDYQSTFRNTDPVDARLVQVAKEVGGTIVTNDFNLNKVAQLQGIRVLNVNELANAVKPVVLPGEEMSVTIVREGKEPEQGVAYLDDGTMVVVERGKDRIGETIPITVTSVLQTVAGKMIFGHPQDEPREHQGGRNARRGRG